MEPTKEKIIPPLFNTLKAEYYDRITQKVIPYLYSPNYFIWSDLAGNNISIDRDMANVYTLSHTLNKLIQDVEISFRYDKIKTFNANEILDWVHKHDPVKRLLNFSNMNIAKLSTAVYNYLTGYALDMLDREIPEIIPTDVSDASLDEVSSMEQFSTFIMKHFNMEFGKAYVDTFSFVYRFDPERIISIGYHNLNSDTPYDVRVMYSPVVDNTSFTNLVCEKHEFNTKRDIFSWLVSQDLPSLWNPLVNRFDRSIFEPIIKEARQEIEYEE